MGLPRRRALTLVELLVVIGLVSVLMAILMPALAQARRQARRTVCLSNLRQLASLFQIYTSENKGRSIQYTYQVGLLALEDVLIPNRPQGVQSPIVFCPEASEPAIREREPGDERYMYPGSTFRPWGFPDSLVWSEHAWSPFRGSSYGMNGWLYTYQSLARPTWADSAEFVSLPAKESDRIPLFADATWSYGQPRVTDLPPATLNPHRVQGINAYSMGRVFCIPRHERAINVVFLDGHARTVPLAELWQLKWNNVWVPTNVTLPPK
jgi:prepilin-type N-terminal cleavage/methylation domain-containing protein/prepilin-type processing-associated H-X9-DG protein